MQKKVIVYTTPTCPYSNLTKSWFTEQGIKFQEIDVSKDPKAAQVMVGISSQMGVPVVDIEGHSIVGWNKSLLKEAMGIV